MWRVRYLRNRSWRNWLIPSITPLPAVAKATWKSARTFITQSITFAIWCWP